MSSSQQRDRTYHQDYIARIRYSNALPPPPNPPKLLDIPNNGLAYYTSTAYASRLAREQPLNIEADAELGMPIDLVGMPGIFEGDESAIQAPPNPPAPHPNDRALLRPLASLGKATTSHSSVSFLRRTEYISTEQSRSRFESTTSKSLISVTPRREKRKTDDSGNRDDPISILRNITKGWNIAYPKDGYFGEDSLDNIKGEDITPAETEAWKNPRHPTNRDPGVKLLDSWEIFPNLEAMTDTGGFEAIKFSTNPAPSSKEYDERMRAGVLKVLDLNPQIAEVYAAKEAAHARDPENNPPVGPVPYEYDFHILDATDGVLIKNAERKVDANDLENDVIPYSESEVRPDGTEAGYDLYQHVHIYETQKIEAYEDKWERLAVHFYDPEMDQRPRKVPKKKGAYFNAVMSTSSIRPRMYHARDPVHRSREEDPDRVDYLKLDVKDPDEELVEHRQLLIKETFLERPKTDADAKEEENGKSPLPGAS